MKQEYSYGAVVYQIKDGQILYLIEFRKLGHVSLPKGHIEKGETPFQCALREIKEETNLEVDLETSFHHTISYSPFPNVWKEVTFYLAKAKTFDVISQPEKNSGRRRKSVQGNTYCYEMECSGCYRAYYTGI